MNIKVTVKHVPTDTLWVSNKEGVSESELDGAKHLFEQMVMKGSEYLIFESDEGTVNLPETILKDCVFIIKEL